MVKLLRNYLSCDACGVRFGLEVDWDYSVAGYPPGDMLKQMRAFVVTMAEQCGWKVEAARHTCPRCK